MTIQNLASTFHENHEVYNKDKLKISFYISSVRKWIGGDEKIGKLAWEKGKE